MRFGLLVPNVGSYGDVNNIVTVAREAEESGWDGVFLWDQIVGSAPWNNQWFADPWVALAAVAAITERVRLGIMVVPLARRRPWKVARETTTLDHLSAGRMTLGVGLGTPPEEFVSFGENFDAKVRARKLDEALDVLTGLWSGEPFSYEGEHHTISDVKFQPTPVQRPRVPIWVGGQWPFRAAGQRGARYDGIYPVKAEGSEPLSTAELKEIMARVQSQRESAEPFDVVVQGEPEKDGSQKDGPHVGAYAEAGATWWLTSISDWWGPLDDMRRRVQAGPPRI